MTYDPNRYILGTWGEFVEVKRRPLIAPGTKPLTKQQLEERRADRAKATETQNRMRADQQLLRQGWVWHAMSNDMRHTSGARISRLEFEQNSAEGLLELAQRRIANLSPPAVPQRPRTAHDVAALPFVKGIKDLRVHQHGDYVTLVLQHSVGGSTAALSAVTLSAPDEVFNSRLTSTVEQLLAAKRRAEYDDWLAQMSQKQVGIAQQYAQIQQAQQALLRPNPLLNPHAGPQQQLFGTPLQGVQWGTTSSGVVTVGDSPHAHSTHAVYDPGHMHLVYDPVHAHSVQATTSDGTPTGWVNFGTSASPQYAHVTKFSG